MEAVNLQVNDLSSRCAEEPEYDFESQNVDSQSTAHKSVHTDSETLQGPDETRSPPEALEKQKVLTKSTRRLSRYGKKAAIRRGRTYLLRSSFSSSRVLRSMSKSATRSLPPSNNSPVDLVKDKRKRRRRRRQSATNDEFSRTRKSVRYLLHRMSYEQNLIDAYVGEGWKGQSSEKIKPEMELQRAKSEIVRCKLKIRSLFQQLEFSISEGKLDDSLFDSEGEICSEDIFCAKCKSTDISAENDIILCDGICDRGFHQKCLNPHLLTDDIPPDDEGWLCPACDCKVDCIDLINEKQGTSLSIKDEWEKVFPEVARFGSEDGQLDNLGLPSDDSEDHDYDPDDFGAENFEADEEVKEGSSSDESDFTSTSEDFGALNHDIHNQKFGLPSDDSEDHDYDPDRREHNENSAKDSSRSDESDFTSDTDDLNVLGNEISDNNEASASPISKYPRIGEGSDTDPLPVNSALCSFEPALGQENVAPLSSKRQREHLDYKKLYEETYGNDLSDSSDDEEWADTSTPANLTSDTNDDDTEGLIKSGGEFAEDESSTKRKKKLDVERIVMPPACSDISSSQKAKARRKVQTEPIKPSATRQKKDSEQPDCNGKRPPLSTRSKYGAAVYQRLQESFRENQYPTRDAKESLARELGMTARKVGKWFENARHSSRVSTRRVGPARGSGNRAGSRDSKEAVASESSGKDSSLGTLAESHHVDPCEAGDNGGGGGREEKLAGEPPEDQQVSLKRELRKRRTNK